MCFIIFFLFEHLVSFVFFANRKYDVLPSVYSLSWKNFMTLFKFNTLKNVYGKTTKKNKNNLFQIKYVKIT